MDEAPRLAGAEGFRDQGKANATIVAELDDHCKAFVMPSARFASAGIALQEVSDGSLLTTRWGLCRPLSDDKAALRLPRQGGGAV